MIVFFHPVDLLLQILDLTFNFNFPFPKIEYQAHWFPVETR